MIDLYLKTRNITGSHGMIDLYLKTPTEAEMTAVLLEAGVIDDEGNPTQGFSVDQIGPITKVIGYAAEDEPIVENYPKPIVENYPDWHTNLRGEFDKKQLALLTPLSVKPRAPFRVWA